MFLPQKPLQCWPISKKSHFSMCEKSSPSAPAALTARELDTLRRTQTVRIIDAGRSDHYIDSHIAGAAWCSRVVLGTFFRDEAHDGPTVLTSEDDLLARLAVGDLNAA